jgi:hypothetical protein
LPSPTMSHGNILEFSRQNLCEPPSDPRICATAWGKRSDQQSAKKSA